MPRLGLSPFQAHVIEFILHLLLALRHSLLVVLPGLLIVFFVFNYDPLSPFLPLMSFFGQHRNLCLSLRLLPLFELLCLLFDIFYAICDTRFAFSKNAPVSLFDVKEPGYLLSLTLDVESSDLRLSRRDCLRVVHVNHTLMGRRQQWSMFTVTSSRSTSTRCYLRLYVQTSITVKLIGRGKLAQCVDT